MPLKLIPPRNSPYWSIRGTHLGVYIDKSTRLSERRAAARVLAKWRSEIESGQLTKAGEPTFSEAALAYMENGGDRRFVGPLLLHFKDLPLWKMTQSAIDAAALAIYPKATPSTRNRQLYTPISAIMKHVGVDRHVRRPKGAGGSRRLEWLSPTQAFALFAAADAGDAEFGILVRLLLYTGLRLGEALAIHTDRIDLSGAFAYIPTTKTAEPRGVHLPPVVVAALANHPRGLDRPGRAFRFTKGSRLYALLNAALEASGVVLAHGTAFHVLRHSYASWMRRFGGLDLQGLVGTGAWADPASAARYAHVIASEEAKRADLLPTENGEILGESGNPGGDEAPAAEEITLSVQGLNGGAASGDRTHDLSLTKTVAQTPANDPWPIYQRLSW